MCILLFWYMHREKGVWAFTHPPPSHSCADVSRSMNICSENILRRGKEMLKPGKQQRLCKHPATKGSMPTWQREFCLPEQVAVAVARSPGAVAAAAPAGTPVVLNPWSLLGEAAGSGRPWCNLAAGQAAAGGARGTRGQKATRGCLPMTDDLSSSG